LSRSLVVIVAATDVLREELSTLSVSAELKLNVRLALSVLPVQ
jgi:hypothetical protein